ncbi:hypothetical protein MUO98_08355, partial [Candidatus Bathyarchaeota archaeon]|nr:hypothetical protein [Candidatus Bathyarchaeota archaeon]
MTDINATLNFQVYETGYINCLTSKAQLEQQKNVTEWLTFTKKSERRKLPLEGSNYFFGFQAVADCCRLDASAAVDAAT